MVRPEAENVARLYPDGFSPAAPVIRMLTEVPLASAIWEATVRCQISSYRRYSSASSTLWSWPGVANDSPAGRMASCASCEFLTLRVYCRGVGETYSLP